MIGHISRFLEDLCIDFIFTSLIILLLLIEVMKRIKENENTQKSEPIDIANEKKEKIFTEVKDTPNFANAVLSSSDISDQDAIQMDGSLREDNEQYNEAFYVEGEPVRSTDEQYIANSSSFMVKDQQEIIRNIRDDVH